MIRKIDPNGRLVLPMELRNKLNWNPGDEIDLIVENNQIKLRKVGNLCSICGENLADFTLKEEGRGICKDCMNKLIQLQQR